MHACNFVIEPFRLYVLQLLCSLHVFVCASTRCFCCHVIAVCSFAKYCHGSGIVWCDYYWRKSCALHCGHSCIRTRSLFLCDQYAVVNTTPFTNVISINLPTTVGKAGEIACTCALGHWFLLLQLQFGIQLLLLLLSIDCLTKILLLLLTT